MRKKWQNMAVAILLSLSCLVSPALSGAAEKETKIFPITENNFRKSGMEVKKAVRKSTTTSTATAKKSTGSSTTAAQQSLLRRSELLEASRNKATNKTGAVKAGAIKISQPQDEEAAAIASAAARLATMKAILHPETVSGTKEEGKAITSASTRASSNASKSKESDTAKSKTASKDASTESVKDNASNSPERSTSATAALKRLQAMKEAKKVTTSSKALASSEVQNLSTSANASNSTIKPKNVKLEKAKGRISEPVIRVKIGTGAHKAIKIDFKEGGTVTNSRGKRVTGFKKTGTFKWALPANTSSKKKKIDYLNDTLTFKPNNRILTFDGKEYRGTIALKITESGAIAVNHVGIEDYLRGVVGSEIGGAAPEESQKAQAVMARTYAYGNRNRHGSDGADVCNTTHCQVYSGIKAEREAVDKAVKSTRGIIATYNGSPVSTLYHATCGGMTSDNDKVFGGAPQPYLRRVVCNFCEKGTKYRWTEELSIPALQKALAKENVTLNDVYGIEIDAPSKLDRVTNMVFTTRKGVQKIKGTTVRRIFNLPSTCFILADNAITLGNSAGGVPAVITKQVPGVSIVSFDENQDAPKQMLLYCKSGLRRSIMPEGGWKCITYSPTGKTVVESASNSANSQKSVPEKKKLSNTPILKVKIFGRGFGHQVGMCQSGAVELGKRGWNYRQILAHYYKEIALRNLGY